MVKAITTFIYMSCLLLGALSGVASADTIVHTERSLYRNIFVTEDADNRCIRFSTQTSTTQSCYSLKNPDHIQFECNKMIMGALYVRPNPKKVLMIGLGGGTLATAFSKVVPGAEMDVVEIDPAMVRVAKDYFNFKPGGRVRLIVEDGRVYVKRAISRGEKYDLIILDAFDEFYIPTHMMTIQFLYEVQKILAPDGVVAANTYCNNPKRYDKQSVTYHSVFGNFFNLKMYWRNTRVIIARPEGLPSEDELALNARALEKPFQKLGVRSSWLLPLFSTEPDWDEKAAVITDQFLPF